MNAPLIDAVKEGMTKAVRELCKRGADLSVRDNNGNTALWLALENKDEDVASVLVRFLLFLINQKKFFRSNAAAIVTLGQSVPPVVWKRYCTRRSIRITNMLRVS